MTGGGGGGGRLGTAVSTGPGIPNGAAKVGGAGVDSSGGFSGGMDVSVIDAAVSVSGGLWVGKDCCKEAIAAFKSGGHTDACTCNGAYASKLRHISMICCGGSKAK